ncbi:unnamed protein product [Owenia fusiformis]|uniref:P-type domain-containing protein n=1 Tax=Owenia fusiformis TaxID=6347 RepID=A0A8S4P8H5_OWEFU|nr:unnamed protein product [Owenia fusiformis]
MHGTYLYQLYKKYILQNASSSCPMLQVIAANCVSQNSDTKGLNGLHQGFAGLALIQEVTSEGSTCEPVYDFLKTCIFDTNHYTRDNCGHSSETSCIQAKCCWDNTVHEVPWCYCHKNILEITSAVPTAAPTTTATTDWTTAESTTATTAESTVATTAESTVATTGETKAGSTIAITAATEAESTVATTAETKAGSTIATIATTEANTETVSNTAEIPSVSTNNTAATIKPPVSTDMITLTVVEITDATTTSQTTTTIIASTPRTVAISTSSGAGGEQKCVEPEFIVIFNNWCPHRQTFFAVTTAIVFILVLAMVMVCACLVCRGKNNRTGDIHIHNTGTMLPHLGYNNALYDYNNEPEKSKNIRQTPIVPPRIPAKSLQGRYMGNEQVYGSASNGKDWLSGSDNRKDLLLYGSRPLGFQENKQSFQSLYGMYDNDIYDSSPMAELNNVTSNQHVLIGRPKIRKKPTYPSHMLSDNNVPDMGGSKMY